MFEPDLKWRTSKKLNDIYLSTQNEFVPKEFTETSLCKYLYEHHGLSWMPKSGRFKVFKRQPFLDYYKINLLPTYEENKSFLSKYYNLDDAKQVSEYGSLTTYDISVLKVLAENQVSALAMPPRKLSSYWFEEKDSKYIEGRPGLEKTILKVLGVEEFPVKDEKDQQYLWVIHCKEPKAIILFENKNIMLEPNLLRSNNIEAWYAGGSNTDKLKHIPKYYQQLPMFYHGDWDYHGIGVILKNVKSTFPKIQLLTPIAEPKPLKSGHHGSFWNKEKSLSGIASSLLVNDAQVLLLEQLIKNNQWIEEESCKLDEMIKLLKL